MVTDADKCAGKFHILFSGERFPNISLPSGLSIVADSSCRLSAHSHINTEAYPEEIATGLYQMGSRLRISLGCLYRGHQTQTFLPKLSNVSRQFIKQIAIKLL
jgi:hypothetical protein